jgi:hypothetical protein
MSKEIEMARQHQYSVEATKEADEVAKEVNKKILVEYNSNNSGGDWWLSDRDWFKLEKAGWVVEWRNNAHKPIASNASKEFNDIKEALIEFEKITGQEVTAQGCNCCGPPHNFTWEENGQKYYESGAGLFKYMFDRTCSHREALECINKKGD